MNLANVLKAICTLMFLMIGADKFLAFLEPPCSMEANISPMVWKIFGVMQIAAGILIWLPKFRKPVAIFFCLFMLTFSIYHLTQSTYDIGGSAFMAVLLAAIAWNPGFLSGRTKVVK